MSRYYIPSQGRFPSHDPIDERGGHNIYAIVWNNPINRWDYLGMCGGPGETPCELAPFKVSASRFTSDTTYTFGLEYGATNVDSGFGPSNHDTGGGINTEEIDASLRRQIHRLLNGCDGLQGSIIKAQAAVASYDDTTAPPGSHRATAEELSKLPQSASDKMSMSNGLSVSVFVNDNGSYTLAFRGTEATSISDWRTDAANAVGFVTGQYSNAIEFTRQFVATCGTNVDLVGHSLGGGLAAAASMATGLTATTFNAAGVGRGVIKGQELNTSNANNLITNYHNTLDPLTIGQLAMPFPKARGMQVTVPMAGLFTSGHSSASIVTNLLAEYNKRGCNE